MRRFGVPGFLLVSLLGLIAPLPARADNVSDAAAAVQQAQDRIEYLQEQVAKLEEDQRDAEANLEQAEVDVADAEARIATLGRNCRPSDPISAPLPSTPSSRGTRPEEAAC
ncbi:MAG: hypothetical protein R2705_19900 [Ilumatobacteraceae bacterium]